MFFALFLSSIILFFAEYSLLTQLCILQLTSLTIFCARVLLCMRVRYFEVQNVGRHTLSGEIEISSFWEPHTKKRTYVYLC
jgi:hypothetical protein